MPNAIETRGGYLPCPPDGEKACLQYCEEKCRKFNGKIRTKPDAKGGTRWSVLCAVYDGLSAKERAAYGKKLEQFYEKKDAECRQREEKEVKDIILREDRAKHPWCRGETSD